MQCCQRGYKNQNFSKIELNKKNKLYKILLSQPKIYSFFQPLFCQRSSAHLQKASTIPTAYFAKELISYSLVTHLYYICKKISNVPF